MVYRYLIEFSPAASEMEEDFLERLKRFLRQYGVNVKVSKVVKA